MNSNVLPDSAAVMAAIERFRLFLNLSWPIFDKILTHHDWDTDAYFFEDWLDANWNLLVCRELLGKGADLQPLSIGTNEIQKDRHDYRLQTEFGDPMIFVTLGTLGNRFTSAPPFDHFKLLKSDGTTKIQPWASVHLTIRKKPPAK